MWNISQDLLSMENNATSRQTFLAATNPSRADILLPASLFELKDVPGMVKEVGHLAILVRDKGRKAFKELDGIAIAKANIIYQFGWRPFVEDIWTCLKFTKGVEKRRKELEALSSSGSKGLRRTISHIWDREEVSVYQNYPLKSDGGTNIFRDLHTRRTVKRWVIGYWKPTYAGSIPSSDDSIRRVLNGTDAGNIAANVWEELPWSWFTDYFFNVGKMIDAGNRTIATPHLVSVMTEQTQYSYHDAWPERHLSAGNIEYIHRYRNVDIDYPSSITASFPTLGAGQLSILGSLAIVKNRRALKL